MAVDDYDDNGGAAASPSGGNGDQPTEEKGGGGSTKCNGDVVGSSTLRPIFLGNLIPSYTADGVSSIFERPILPSKGTDKRYGPIPVDRIDHKRGYCFVFLKDVRTQEEKEMAESFVSDINGMAVAGVSNGLRAEFARGDGRIKKKEDERRKNIEPSDTLFVVNFHEQTTTREHLQMLFEPYGELVRIDMKRNYAFVQFKSVDVAIKAKEATNGGKVDQSVITVEYVARQRHDSGGRRDRGDRDRRRDGGGGGPDYRRGGDYHRGPPPPSYPPYYRGPPPGPPPMHHPPPHRYDDEDRYRRDYYDDRDRRYGIRDDYRYNDRGRSRSPPRGYGRGRSRSRSPPSHRRRSPARDHSPPRDRSPPPSRGADWEDGRDRGDSRRYDRYNDRASSRSRSPPGRYRSERERDRGYR